MLSTSFERKLDGRLQDLRPSLDGPERRRRIDATVGFLQLCVAHPGEWYAPSEPVDEVWHEMITHTRDYRALCDELGGFVDHEPFTGEEHEGRPTVLATKQQLVARGMLAPADEDLWQVTDAARCCGGCSPIKFL